MTEPCIIPDRKGNPCTRPGAMWIANAGRICERHANQIWQYVEDRDTNWCDRPIAGSEARDYQRDENRKKRAVARRKPTAHGEIYFVLVDGLIKVGWTSKLADRIRAYGPKAILLANYPGTRSEESTLHKQLTPARAHGREWYHDGDILRMFVDQAIATHGPPRFQTVGWTEPKPIVAGKRAMRYRN